MYVCVDVRIVLPVKRNKLSFNDSYMHICIYVYMYIYIPCFFGLLVREAIIMYTYIFTNIRG